tara:strand:+ start:651 stop:1115 length:465 start_codon:yes stop_codon:yes gene_type:complete
MSYGDGNQYIKHGDFQTWSVFAKKNKELCYTIAKPIRSEGSYNLRGRVSIVVARRPNEDSKNFIGIDFGYSFSDNSKVKIIFDKNIDFELDTFEQTAWTNPKDKTKLDDKIIEEMIKGIDLEVFGESERGTETRDIYSLKGFSKAYNKIKETCG